MGIQERKERERERRRQQIMVAAKRVFTDKGFSKATMEDIAKEAELSPGTLYLYFKNKDDLFFSLMTPVIDDIGVQLEKIWKKVGRKFHSQLPIKIIAANSWFVSLQKSIGT